MENDVIFDTLDMKKLDDQVPWDVDTDIWTCFIKYQVFCIDWNWNIFSLENLPYVCIESTGTDCSPTIAKGKSMYSL